MSNARAIAAVTATLRDRIGPAVSGAVGGATVTTERPVKIQATDGDGDTRVNLFLYQVTPNAALRNTDLATRRADGTLARRPRIGLDLHYLLSFIGDESEQEPERLLGAVVSELHAHPQLERDAIRATIATATGGDPAHYLGTSDLAEQVELVRFTPIALNLEELSKLWSVFFQVPYCLSLAYVGSVVTLEAELTPAPALPVRGRTLAGEQLRMPRLESVEPADPAPAIVIGGTVVLRGRQLRGDTTRVRIGDDLVTPDLDAVGDHEIRLALATPPFAAGALRAGVTAAQVIHRRWLGIPPEPHGGVESQAVAFVLRPRIRHLAGVPQITLSAEQLDPEGVPFRDLTVEVEPEVGARQRADILLNQVGGGKAFALPVPERAADGALLEARIRGLVAAEVYRVRVRVEGAESLLDADVSGFTGPEVIVP